MPKKFSISAFIIMLIVSGVGCAHTLSARWAKSVQAPAAQTQKFIPVEGSDLRAKIEAAVKQARASSSPTPFWTAYTFDVRPGVAVDPDVSQFNGSMESYSGFNLFIGKSGGVTVETRNLGVFLLQEPGGNAITRLDIYNLERRREYSNYPVYWLGRAGNEESLNFLRSLVESSQPRQIVEHATVAIGLHDDPRVGPILKNFIRNSANQEVRATSVFWLGQIGGEQAFLADLVRNEQESNDLRGPAAYAIGVSRDQKALTTLLNLYEAVTNREVKRRIVHAVSINENKEGAISFLLKVAKSDADRETRGQAIHWLGHVGGESVIEELMKIFTADQDREVKSRVLHALSQMSSPRAHAMVLEIARTADNVEVRRQAIHWLGQKNDESALDELIKLYDAERNNAVREQILHALSQMKSPRAEAKLFDIARHGDNIELRRQAIHWLGQKASQRSLEMLRDMTSNSNAETEVQMQALHAISQRSPDEAVPLLIKIARTHPSAAVRRQAIHWLGQTGDERALEFFREVLTK